MPVQLRLVVADPPTVGPGIYELVRGFALARDTASRLLRPQLLAFFGPKLARGLHFEGR